MSLYFTVSQAVALQQVTVACEIAAGRKLLRALLISSEFFRLEQEYRRYKAEKISLSTLRKQHTKVRKSLNQWTEEYQY